MNFDTKKAILVSFFTQNFIPEWFELENDVRCQVNFVYLLYISNFISNNQLLAITQNFSIQLKDQTNLILRAFGNPSSIVQNELKSYKRRTKEEKLILPTCYVKNEFRYDCLCSVLQNRSFRACKNKLQRIISSSDQNSNQ